MKSDRTKRTYAINGRQVKVSIRPRSTANPVLIMDYYPPNKPRKRKDLKTDDLETAIRIVERIAKSPEFAKEFPEKRGENGASASLDERDPTLSRVIDYYLDTAMVVAGRKEKTIRGYREILWDFKTFCANAGHGGQRVGRVSQITREVVDSYGATLTKNGQATKTIRNKLATIRACLYAAVDADIIKESPVKKWLMPKLEESEIDPLEAERLGYLVRGYEEHMPRSFNCFRYIAFTGNRPSDATGIQWPYVNMRTRVVERVQPKVKRLALYQLCAPAYESLVAEKKRGCPGPNGEVFTRPDGKLFDERYLRRDLRRVLDRIEFERDVTIKDLRHTFGSLMANEPIACPLPVLQVLMGHSDVNMTMRYVHASDAFPALARLEATVLNDRVWNLGQDDTVATSALTELEVITTEKVRKRGHK